MGILASFMGILASFMGILASFMGIAIDQSFYSHFIMRIRIPSSQTSRTILRLDISLVFPLVHLKVQSIMV